jgi:prepilin-type N-terminal cleavage/methylation domain-containing protein
MSATRGRESGFTLPELLLAVVILAIVVVPLTAGIIVFLRTSDATSERFVASHDAQLVSVYLPPDLQSASQVATSGAECSGVPNRLVLRWTATEALGSTVTFVAAYSLREGGDGGWELVRSFCRDSDAPENVVVAHNLAGSDAVDVEPPEAAGEAVEVTPTGAPSRADPDGYTFTVSGAGRADP